MSDQKIEHPVFSTLIHSIASSATISMGLVSKMEEKKNMEMAEFNIELLMLLREKTKGNLNTEEKQLLDSYIQDLQITFSQNKDSSEALDKNSPSSSEQEETRINGKNT